MAKERGRGRILAAASAGVVIGAVEVVLAVAFASLLYGSYLVRFLANGIGLYLVAGAITLAGVAWVAGRRGVVGSVQDAAAAVLGVVAGNIAVHAFGSLDRAFLSAVAATMVVTAATGITFVLLGRFRLGNLARFVPYPVVGGFLAGTGWLLLKGGISVAAGSQLYLSTLRQFTNSFSLARWLPALGFGVVLLVAVRVIKRPLVIPVVLAGGILLFVVGMLITGSNLEAAREGRWLMGPFASGRLLQPWTLRALTGADWRAVIGEADGIATAVFVAVLACMFNVSGVELLLRTDLDTNRELRDVGVVNVVSAPFGGIPGYHAVSLTSLARQMGVDARTAGFVAAAVPLAIAVFGASLIEVIPRMIVGGVLVFVGLGFLVEWLFDVRRSLPLTEYVVLLLIFLAIAFRGFLPGVVFGLIMAFVLFTVNYSRIALVHDVEFGSTHRSNVDRPPAERAVLRASAGRVQILRVNGFVFFGTASGLLDRIRERVDAGSLRYLVIDLGRVTGMDSSAVLSFRQVVQLAETHGFELVFTGAPDRVRAQLRRGGVDTVDGMVRFEPDLDHGLEWCEDGLLAADPAIAEPGEAVDVLRELPDGVRPLLERQPLAKGEVLIHQGAAPDDLFVLESGRLRIEMVTPDGDRMRLRSVTPGVVVGEVALYLGGVRTADVVAETPSVVLRLGRAAIDRLEAEQPEVAADLHRWLATTLAERLTDALRTFEAQLD